MENTKYPYGFYMTKFDNRLYNNYQKINVGECNLFYSCDNQICDQQYDQTRIILLGYAFDIRDGRKKPATILKALINFRQYDYSQFLNEMKFLNGRYVLIVKHKELLNVYNDASGMKAIHYHNYEPLVGSHDALLYELSHGNVGDYTSYPNFGMTINTRYDDIKLLLPNLTLEMNSFKKEKYFPLEESPLLTESEIKEELFTYLDQSLEWLKRSEKAIVLSITGGADSKVSLSVLKPIIKEVETFTYLKDIEGLKRNKIKIIKNDIAIVESMIENLGLSHQYLYFSKRKNVEDNLLSNIQKNSYTVHNHLLAAEYYKNFNQNKHFHIRSTGISEMHKFVFPFDTIHQTDWSVNKIAYYLRKYTKGLNEDDHLKRIDNALEESMLDDFYNYNPLELLYCIFHLGQWQSGLIKESDVAFDTFTIFNATRFIELFNAYPADKRFNYQLHRDIINKYWPILNFWDINDEETIIEKYYKIEEEHEHTKDVLLKFLPSIISTQCSIKQELCRTKYKQGYYFKFNESDIKGDYYYIKLDISQTDLNSLTFDIKFNYKNEKGRDYISVISNIESINGDIVDLFGTYSVQINKESSFEMKIKHNFETKSKSWLEASKVWIGNFEME